MLVMCPLWGGRNFPGKTPTFMLDHLLDILDSFLDSVNDSFGRKKVKPLFVEPVTHSITTNFIRFEKNGKLALQKEGNKAGQRNASGFSYRFYDVNIAFFDLRTIRFWNVFVVKTNNDIANIKS